MSHVTCCMLHVACGRCTFQIFRSTVWILPTDNCHLWVYSYYPPQMISPTIRSQILRKFIFIAVAAAATAVAVAIANIVDICVSIFMTDKCNVMPLRCSSHRNSGAYRLNSSKIYRPHVSTKNGHNYNSKTICAHKHTRTYILMYSLYKRHVEFRANPLWHKLISQSFCWSVL